MLPAGRKGSTTDRHGCYRLFSSKFGIEVKLYVHIQGQTHAWEYLSYDWGSTSVIQDRKQVWWFQKKNKCGQHLRFTLIPWKACLIHGALQERGRWRSQWGISVEKDLQTTYCKRVRCNSLSLLPCTQPRFLPPYIVYKYKTKNGF